MSKKVVILSLIVFASGFFLRGLFDNLFFQKKAIPAYPVRQKGFKYTSPLLYCENPQGDEAGLTDLNNDLTNFIVTSRQDGLLDDASVYIRLPRSGTWTSVNDSDKYSPASLLKVPVMMSYFKNAETNPALLTKELKYDINDTYDNQNFMPEKTLEKDKSYKIKDLIERMIIYSDNVAEDILVSNISKKEFSNLFYGMDIELLDYDHQEDSMNVKTFSYFFRALFNSTYLNKNMSETALSILTRTTFSKGIVAGVPKNVVVAHKFAERAYSSNFSKQLHDCGIVYFPQNPYLICIMTRGNSFENLEAAIKTISQKTYAAVKKWNEQQKS